MQWLPRLEINRAVFYLYQHIVGELPVERFDITIGLFCSVPWIDFAIDKLPPHHGAFMRRQRGGKHIGPVGVGATIVIRAGLPLRIGLDQKTAEVRNGRVYFIRLRRPPCAHLWIERVGGF